MATQVQKLENHFPQRILQVDGILELCLGAGLVLDAQAIAGWLGLSTPAIEIGGIFALAFGAVLLYMAQRNANRNLLQIVAVLNIAFIALTAAVLALDWNMFANEGRWLLALVVDVFLVVGLVEYYARRFVA